ncbi:MAG: tRNA 2-selenouridine(34) synthase MnmH [Desulfuromonadia bacterium]
MTYTLPFTPSLLESHTIIDVRSPSEYGEDHIPTSLNIPLLNDEERAIVGTIYKEKGPREARITGLGLVSHRFPEMVSRIVETAGEKPLVICCWRGGLRSRSVVNLLDLCGIHAAQLAGGYQSFRRSVLSFFEDVPSADRFVVLHGMTGVGKSALLTILAERGEDVIDLEGIAHHRGSAFGGFGLFQDFSQKRFETDLWDAFRKLSPDRAIVMEGESRRIGRYYLPGKLFEAMARARTVWCVASRPTRIRRLAGEYARQEYRGEILASLDRIRKRLGDERHRELRRLIDRWEVEAFTERLIDWYYDPLYYRSPVEHPDLVLDLESLEDAADRLRQFLATGN